MRSEAGFEVEPPASRHRTARANWWRSFLVAVAVVLVGLLSAPIVAPAARAQSLRITTYDALSTGYDHRAPVVRFDSQQDQRRGPPTGPFAAPLVDSVSVSWVGVAANSVSASGIRFSQSSVNGAAEIEASMRANGWVGDAIDVVRMGDGGLTSLDHTRVLAAKRAGIDV